MSQLPAYPDSQSGNPVRSPYWRWQRAGQLFRLGQYFSTSRDDVPTGRALTFLRAIYQMITPRHQRRLLRHLGDVAQAHALFGGPQDLRLEVEACILARRSVEQIARRVDVPVEVITSFEAVFFDVRDQMGATNYIHLQVIGDPWPTGSPTIIYDRLIKWAAYVGGPLELDAALAYVAEKTGRRFVGIQNYRLTRECRSAIDCLVAAQSLQVNDSTSLNIVRKAPIVRQILASRPHRATLADVIVTRSSLALGRLALQADLERADSSLPPTRAEQAAGAA